jgi:hypothetical protein
MKRSTPCISGTDHDVRGTAARIGILVIGVLALTGCGRDGDRREVGTVVTQFYAAVQDHHGARACELLSSDTRKALEQQASASCARAIEQVKLSPGRLGPVRVYSTEASAALVGGDTVFLGDTAQGWRIDAAGCRPQGHGEPADCEVQA